MYTVSKKIPDVIDCNVAKDYQILISFGRILGYSA